MTVQRAMTNKNSLSTTNEERPKSTKRVEFDTLMQVEAEADNDAAGGVGLLHSRPQPALDEFNGFSELAFEFWVNNTRVTANAGDVVSRRRRGGRAWSNTLPKPGDVQGQKTFADHPTLCSG